MTASRLERSVRDRLHDVLDPCSCFTEDPVNIVDLGLVEDIHVDDGIAHIELLLTSPGCTYLPYIERDIKSQVVKIDGIETVETAQVTDQIWTRARMDDDVRAARRARLQSRLDAAGVTPYTERAE